MPRRFNNVPLSAYKPEDLLYHKPCQVCGEPVHTNRSDKKQHGACKRKMFNEYVKTRWRK